MLFFSAHMDTLVIAALALSSACRQAVQHCSKFLSSDC